MECNELPNYAADEDGMTTEDGTCCGACQHKPAPAPAMGHHRSSEGRLPGKNAPMYDKGARVMNDKGHMGNHNMGNHNNAHKAPNREIAMNTRSNHGGAGHFGGRR